MVAPAAAQCLNKVQHPPKKGIHLQVTGQGCALLLAGTSMLLSLGKLPQVCLQELHLWACPEAVQWKLLVIASILPACEVHLDRISVPQQKFGLFL